MIKQFDAEKRLLKHLDTKPLGPNKWTCSKFERFNTMSTTEKGDIVEDFFKELLIDCGWDDVFSLPGRRGDYDLKGTLKNIERTIVKTSFGLCLAVYELWFFYKIVNMGSSE